MSAASPPPPPDPNRFNPFASTCGSSPSSSSRRPPLLRRSKTVANPESPLRWRREPLADVTNLVLGRRENWTGRLQRVPTLDHDPLPSLSPSRSDDVDTSSSPATPSRIPRPSAMLRRTRSAAPGFAGSSSPSDVDVLPSASTRREPTVLRDSTVVRDDGGSSSLPRPAGATASGLRRLTRSLTGGSNASGSSTAGSSGAIVGSRRCTFGGLATLPPGARSGRASVERERQTVEEEANHRQRVDRLGDADAQGSAVEGRLPSPRSLTARQSLVPSRCMTKACHSFPRAPSDSLLIPVRPYTRP
ncbi:hypothetical protein NBRC10512_002585 [Rhodotorula toruloides]|uniref:Uncharacterized protein n=1 Tax=Rhodotorula toruloides (strain NP11) TaxID=1130832 RepID=M7XZX2_RHOT1|nr:uncharacterized protein RHTO_00316 [Rhodotorula toruloides NP11]EMS25888.1 hypothetical protein RHTO_00316 [Rhodotorula toruloides NP11]